LHILDFNSDICVFSQKELDLSNNEICAYITKHIEHIQSDDARKQGAFINGSLFRECLQNYISSNATFIDFTNIIANKLYDQVSVSDKRDSIDFMVVDFTNENISHIALLLLTNKVAYTHQVINDAGNIHNEIIKHHAILPSTAQKVDSYAIIRCDDLSINFSDKKRMIDGKDIFILPELLLQSTSTISSKEAIKLVNQITTRIAEEHGQNTTVALSKAKNFLVENAEISSSFSPAELGREVFADSETMQDEFERRISESELPPDIRIEKSFAIRTGRNHKIKTDTGIEITFPVEYFENRQYIEFVNNPDGTISIELKNIGKIINR